MCIQKDLFEFELDSATLQRLDGFTGEITVGIRPEDISVSTGKGIEGRIYRIENMGMGKILTLKIGDHLLKIIVDAEHNAQIDAPGHFQLNQERLHFFRTENGGNLL